FFLAGNRGQTFIYRVRLDGGVPVPFFAASDMLKRDDEKTPPELLRPYQITSFSVSNTSASNSYAGFAFTRSDALHPAEVWQGSAHRNVARRVSAHNELLLRPLALSEPGEIRFKRFDATTVGGWLMKPMGWRDA